MHHRFFLTPYVLCAALALVLCGCEGRRNLSPESLAPEPHASGNNQFGFHGEELPDPLRVIVESARIPGLLGGKGGRKPIPDTPVTFAIETPNTGASLIVANEPVGDTATVRSGKGGVAAIHLRLGDRSQDVEVVAAVNGLDPVRFRAGSGVRKVVAEGTNLSGPTKGKIPEFGVALTNPDGSPATGVVVHFSVVGEAKKSNVGDERVLTNAQGQAKTSWTLGEKSGTYSVMASVKDTREGIPDAARFQIEPIMFKAVALDKTGIIIKLFGGLAIFVFGMRTMSGGLQRMADRRLKTILQTMTRNRFLAIFAGAGLTAAVQSSSATTVMTVGFVNAGLITLVQAIGVIYGANIGTTVTAQIIAFKLNQLAFPAIACGLLLSLLGRKPAVKHLGEAILGFGFLFLGMTIMSDILKPLRTYPEFIQLFSQFDSSPDPGSLIPKWQPALICILIGTVTTVLVQSSSATIGLVLALCSQDLLTFYTAVPLVLGDNIGTTITAIFASLGANRNAKRTALAHTLFNVFGAVYMYILLFVPLSKGGPPIFLGFVDWFTPGDAFSSTPENLLRHVANAHTSFNVLNCVLFIPFIPIMARICQKIIPVTEADQEKVLQYLEPRLLQQPTIALEQSILEIGYMVRRGQKSVNEACDLFCGKASGLEKKILAREEFIDRLQHEITAYLVELSRMSLPSKEATLIPALIHAVNDAERVGDHAEDLVEIHQLRKEHKHKLSDFAIDSVRQFQELINKQFETTLLLLEKNDEGSVQHVVDIEREITDVLMKISEEHVARLEREECDVQTGVLFLDFLAHLERVGDHLLNIAERAGVIRD
jgi:Na/Pi-cotransporter